MVKLHSLNPGDKVLVKVGRNLISCEVVEVRPDRAVVKSDSTGREFKTMKVEELVSRAGSVVAEAMEYVAERVAEAVAPQVAAQVAAMPELAAGVADAAAPAEEPPAEPAQDAPKPQKKLSLVNAGIEVMKQEGRPLNTREIVKLATERGLWTPTACRTPEQSLYGAFFLEMKNSSSPRIKKSAERGKFELA
jgi:sRNA-binding protein